MEAYVLEAIITIKLGNFAKILISLFFHQPAYFWGDGS